MRWFSTKNIISTLATLLLVTHACAAMAPSEKPQSEMQTITTFTNKVIRIPKWLPNYTEKYKLFTMVQRPPDILLVFYAPQKGLPSLNGLDLIPAVEYYRAPRKVPIVIQLLHGDKYYLLGCDADGICVPKAPKMLEEK